MLNHIKSLLRSKAAQSSACKKEGDAHLKAGRLDEAVDAYRRALALDAQNAEAHVGMGYAFNERRNYVSAKAALANALAIDAENADAHYMQGTIARQQGDVAAALQHFDRALECRTEFEFAYRDLFALLVQSGQLERAKEILDKAAVACPGSAGIHDMRGKVLAARLDHTGAVDSFRKASSLAPGTAEYHKNLADALVEIGDSEQAVASYGKALWFDPDYYDAHVALGDEMQRQGNYDEAVVHYRAALALQPQSAVAHVNLGVALQAQGNLDKATASYRRAIEIEPRMVVAHANLGSALMMRGGRQDAIACFERVVEIDPQSPLSHILVALRGGASERAPSDYVEKLFDSYAARFDSHLVKGLSYTVPEKLRDLLQPRAALDGERWTVLDLGCGTGLAGAAVAPFVRSLVGVDLSSKMLDKARERKLYDRLEQLDLLTMMLAEPASAYDLVIAADVFVYVGKLDELTAEAFRLLRPGGYFAFSVESLDALAQEVTSSGDGQGYRLNETGRFAHSAHYLARLREKSGFKDLSTTVTPCRAHDGKGVQGYLVVWKRILANGAVANVQPDSNI